MPALEIDISRMGGVVTESEFARLIVDEVAGKRWLFHPLLARENSLLEAELAYEASMVNEQERIYSETIATPANEWAKLYLAAVISHGEIRVKDDEPDSDPSLLQNSLSLVRRYAENLASYGYPEAADDVLFRQRGNILERLLSLKLNRAVGYKLGSAWQVINTILQERPPYSQWQTLYLIGIKAWQPSLNQEQANRVAEWRSEVIRSLNAGERKYQRDRKYDRLLKLLFPELETALLKPLGNSSFNTSPESISAVINKSHNDSIEPWLRGKALEAWKRDHPEAAKQWEEMQSKRS